MALWPSRPGELHPESLTEPDVRLSTYPARATARRLPPSVKCRAPPVAGCPDPNRSDPPPSLHEHYTRFFTTTGQSAPGRRIATFGLAVGTACAFRLPSSDRFSSPHESPNESHAPSTPDIAWPVGRLPPCSS